MQANIEKQDQTLVITIPQSISDRLSLVAGQTVDLTVVGNTLRMSPSGADQQTLEQLLAGITDDSLHQEIDFGPPVGKEAW